MVAVEYTSLRDAQLLPGLTAIERMAGRREKVPLEFF